MKALIFLALGTVTLWLQLTVAPLMAVFGYKPNLMLLTVVVIGLRWSEPWLFLYAAVGGLAMDVFSHDLLGVYALSYFAVSFLSRYIGVSVYENSLLVGVAAVFGVSVAEGILSLTLFDFLDDSVPWWFRLFTIVLPGALVTALWSPVVFYLLRRVERWTRYSEAYREP